MSRYKIQLVGRVQLISRRDCKQEKRETISKGIYFALWQKWEAWVIRLGMPAILLGASAILYHPPDSFLCRLLTAGPIGALLCLYFWLLGWRHARELAMTVATDGLIVLNHTLALYPWQGSETVSVVGAGVGAFDLTDSEWQAAMTGQTSTADITAKGVDR